MTFETDLKTDLTLDQLWRLLHDVETRTTEARSSRVLNFERGAIRF